MEKCTQILVVEDEAIIALEMTRRLERLGYQITGAISRGEDVVEAVQSNPPNLILMDIMLAGELDGIDAARKVQEQFDIPVVYLTAHSDDNTLERAKTTTPYGYIVKPIDQMWLLSTIEIALHKHNVEIALRKTEQRFRSLFETMQSACALHEMIIDESGTVVDFVFLEVNPAYCSMVKRTREDLLLRRGSEVFPGLEPYWIRLYNDVAQKGAPIHLEEYFGVLGKHLDIVAYSPEFGQVATIIHDLSAQKNVEQKLEYRTFHDPLTDLPNRALCLDRLTQVMERAKRNLNIGFCVLFIDLDRFKIVNDSLGPTFGDTLLQQVGRLIASTVRAMDTVARVGGDEFVVVLEDIDNRAEAVHAAKRILDRLKRAVTIDDQTVYTSASIGILFGPNGYNHPGKILQDANIAMHHARAQGGGRYKVFKESMRAIAERALSLETELRLAIEAKSFELYFQPIYALSPMKLSGFEALLRWNRNGSGLVSPAEFIPIAEETGLIIPLGMWVFEQALAMLETWSNMRPDLDLTMAVNLSARQFSQPELVSSLSELILRSNIDPKQLKLEITETTVMEKPAIAAGKLRALKELGVAISIDDFGTGYSSLGYLQRFPIDTLKVDRAFVSCMDEFENRIIVKSVIGLAHNLEMDVVAEGIETQEQCEALVRLGCQFGQGFLFSRPVEQHHAQNFVLEA
ncbi:two-component system response regulator [Desulfovibrio inopinatus]|uniref:two-component system response regulator n=1 Tax=Desulfovibrio inopinatus TaxID=102109 RepID=UPI000425AF1D|nr:EAL domain-containing protein [Desulfovibrio inopinatus]